MRGLGVTLTEFLLARIAEDEAVARAATESSEWVVREYPYEGISVTDSPREEWESEPSPEAAHMERFSPARIRAECEAKRRIVALHTPKDIACGDCEKCDGAYGEHESYPCQTMRSLAPPYADHPDYDESWRP